MKSHIIHQQPYLEGNAYHRPREDQSMYIEEHTSLELPKGLCSHYDVGSWSYTLGPGP